MTAAVLKLIIEQRATWKKRFRWRDKAGTPIDLRGYRARMQIREAATRALVADLSDENGKITLGGQDGTIEMALSAAETTAMKPVPMLYDLKLITADGIEYRKLQGAVVLSPGQTE